MGLKCTPDFAPQIMEQVLQGLNNVEVYLDDIGIFSKIWEEHLLVLEKVIPCLKASCFTVNPLKCEWAIQEPDWLGFWLIPTSFKLWKKCIPTILDQKLPHNINKMCSFLGAVNLTSLCGLNGQIDWDCSVMNLEKRPFVGLWNGYCIQDYEKYSGCGYPHDIPQP